MKTNLSKIKIDQLISSLVGKPAWEASPGVGSFITIEFGKPLPPRKGLVFGEQHLWVAGFDWKLVSVDKTLINQDSPRAESSSGLRKLNGKNILSVNFDDKKGNLQINFSGAFQLSIRPAANASEDDECIVYLDSQTVLIIEASGNAHTEHPSRN